MTREEFRKLSKLDVSPSYYSNVVENLYMNSPLSKDKFCAEYYHIFERHDFQFCVGEVKSILKALKDTKRSQESEKYHALMVLCDYLSEFTFGWHMEWFHNYNEAGYAKKVSFYDCLDHEVFSIELEDE